MRYPTLVQCAGLILCLAVSGCATYHRSGLEPKAARLVEQTAFRPRTFPADLEDQILALDPLHVTEKQIREVLSQAPAPRIINIHGGIYPVHRRLISFSEFLIGMGYPAFSITNAADGTFTYSCYESSDMVAGMIAWYYEKEGLRPIIVGHSQGGFQAVKILQKFAGEGSRTMAVWNPLTWRRENRYEITDPLTGQKRPVVGLQLSYVTSMGAGGVTRVLPNQWDMAFKLRSIPDSVEEFTGFYKGRDLLGGDFLGYGSMNLFHANGTARVRNIELPAAWKHREVPDTKHLLKNQAIIDRLNDYTPPADPNLHIPANEETMNPETLSFAWAADVWYSIKKHWVLELQRLIRAQRALRHGQ
jgi:pimeloyl-ACP methyl ester carboxylesterase